MPVREHSSKVQGLEYPLVDNDLVTSQEIAESLEFHLNTGKFYLFTKRALDIVISLVALVLLSPLFLLTTFAVMVDGGPPFFIQERIGKDGNPFQLYKFRSMCVDAEQQLKNLQNHNEADGPVFKMADDPRITRVGKFIRRFSIDEMPQLFNVLFGQMSIVGPRPPLPKEVAEYNEYHMIRLLVKPGITCYWQCSGRSKIGFDEWINLDIEYIEDQSLWTDIKILFKTIPAVLKGDGAW